MPVKLRKVSCEILPRAKNRARLSHKIIPIDTNVYSGVSGGSNDQDAHTLLLHRHMNGALLIQINERGDAVRAWCDTLGIPPVKASHLPREQFRAKVADLRPRTLYLNDGEILAPLQKFKPTSTAAPPSSAKVGGDFSAMFGPFVLAAATTTATASHKLVKKHIAGSNSESSSDETDDKISYTCGNNVDIRTYQESLTDILASIRTLYRAKCNEAAAAATGKKGKKSASGTKDGAPSYAEIHELCPNMTRKEYLQIYHNKQQ